MGSEEIFMTLYCHTVFPNVLWVLWHRYSSAFCCVMEAQVYLFIFCCRTELFNVLTVLSSIIIEMLDIDLTAHVFVLSIVKKRLQP